MGRVLNALRFDTCGSYTLELQPTEGIGLITGGTTYRFVVTQGNYPGN